MDQDNATMTFMATASILSPLRRLQLPNNLLIGFDTEISGIPVTCIAEDENIMRYMIDNNIVEGSVVRLIGRTLVPFGVYFFQNQLPTSIVLELQLVDLHNTTNIQGDDDERPRKRRSDERDQNTTMPLPLDNTATNTNNMMTRDNQNVRPSKKRRLDEEMMEIDGVDEEQPYDGPTVGGHGVFDGDTEDYFYTFFAKLQLLRIYFPDTTNEADALDLELNQLMRLYHDIMLLMNSFVQPATAFQRRLKALCQNSNLFNRDTVLFPPISPWPSIEL